MWFLAAYRWTHSPGRLAWSEGWRPLGAIPHSSYELVALAVALSYDDSTVNIVVVVIINDRNNIQVQRLPAQTRDPSFVTLNSSSSVTKRAADLFTTRRIPHTDLHNRTHFHSIVFYKLSTELT